MQSCLGIVNSDLKELLLASERRHQQLLEIFVDAQRRETSTDNSSLAHPIDYSLTAAPDLEPRSNQSKGQSNDKEARIHVERINCTAECHDPSHIRSSSRAQNIVTTFFGLLFTGYVGAANLSDM